MGKGKGGKKSTGGTQRMYGMCDSCGEVEVERAIIYSGLKKLKVWWCKQCRSTNVKGRK